jgi:hypothetical protein
MSHGLAPPARLTIDDAHSLVTWMSEPALTHINLDEVDHVHMYGIVAIAALARRERKHPPLVLAEGQSKAAKFALAVGIEDAINNRVPTSPGEAGQTVKPRRAARFEDIEPLASVIAKLVFPELNPAADTQRTVYYVLVELMRNVVQHSRDPLGGVIAAQRMYKGERYIDRPCVQIAVADTGVGIHEALRPLHPNLTEPRVALVKAIEPHISGTFEEGLTGSRSNAGMGLFFISEMAKRTEGRLLIATRGATLMLRGHELQDVNGPRNGFPGTLVAFEMPVDHVAPYGQLIADITQLAEKRVPKRAVHRWLKYAEPAGSARRFLVRVAAENTTKAAEFAQNELCKLVVAREPVVLDFQNVPVCTQSFLHALLFESLRLAWAVQAPIYVVNVDPAVKHSLDLLESYALGG